MSSEPEHIEYAPDAQNIVIMGGGIAGCLTALQLGRRKDEQGRLLYHITILEKEPVLFTAASLMAYRLHNGGEYAKSTQTALDCLHYAIIHKLLMPSEMYIKQDHMNFAVAQGSQESGELTFEKFKRHYQILHGEYKKYFDMVQQSMGWTAEETADRLLGHPKDFYKVLDRNELKTFRQDYPTAHGVIKTQEHGINTPLYLASVEHELKLMPNVDIMVNCEVLPDAVSGSYQNFHIKYKYTGGPITQKETGKTIYANSIHSIEADQVIQAAGYGAFEITSMAEGETVNVYQRGIMLVDMSNVPHKPQVFSLIDKHGFMVSYLNDKYALIYIPEAAYLGGGKELKAGDSAISEEWDNHPLDNDPHYQNWSQRYFEMIQKAIPGLENAIPVKLLIAPAINPSRKLEERQHIPVKERSDCYGYHEIILTKATYAAGEAAQISEIVDLRRREPEIPHSPPSLEEIIRNHKKYSLDDIKPRIIEAAHSLEALKLPSDMYVQPNTSEMGRELGNDIVEDPDRHVRPQAPLYTKRIGRGKNSGIPEH